MRAAYDHKVIKEDALDELAEAVRGSGLDRTGARGRGDGLRRRRLGLCGRGACPRARRRVRARLARQLRAARGRRRRRGRRPAPLRGAAHRPPRRAAAEPARGQPPGCRARRSATPPPSGCASAPAPRLDRDRPHPHRPRRDRALPARGLARARALLGLSRRATGAWSGRCSGSGASETRELAIARRPAVRRRRDQRGHHASPATGSAPRCCRCCASSARRRARTSPRPGPSSPRRRSCSSGSCSRRSTTAGAGAGRSAIRADGARGLGAGAAPARPAGARRARRRAPGRRWGAQRAAEIVRLAARPEGGEVELGGGLRAICERGLIRFRAAEADAAPSPRLSLRLPGLAGSAAGRSAPSFVPARSSPRAPTSRRSTPARSAAELEVRTWRDGDRIRPLGMGGTKTLAGPVHRPRGPALAARTRSRW